MKHNEWIATHSGWFLLAPILLAEMDTDAPVPIPRWGLGWWFELNLLFNDWVLNTIVWMIDPDAVGYLFYGIRKLKRPRVVQVPNTESLSA